MKQWWLSRKKVVEEDSVLQIGTMEVDIDTEIKEEEVEVELVVTVVTVEP